MSRGFDWFGTLEPEEIRDRQRVYRLSTGSNIIFQKVPVYTLWEMHFSSGTLPKSLKGRYLSFPKAFAAAKRYFLNHPQRKITIEEEVINGA